MECLGERDEEPCSGAVRVWREFERALVEACRGRKRVEAECAVASLSEGSAGSLGERPGLCPRRPSELERAAVMVREHLRMVLGSAERLDPLGCEAVFLDARRARDLCVGDVPDEDVRKRILRLAGHG